MWGFGERGAEDGQFWESTGIALGESDIIYLADRSNHRVQCFDSKGKFLRKWGKYGKESGEFIYPSGLTLYNPQKQAVAAEMRVVSQLALFPPGLLPLCLSYVGDECIYVADTGNHRIQTFTLDGVFQRQWGGLGCGDGQFDQPRGCAVDKFEILYVMDSGNRRVQVFDAIGTFIRKWDCNLQQGASISQNSFVYQSVYHYRRPQCAKYSYVVPDEVLADHDMIYVLDTYDNSVHQFRQDGTFIRKWSNHRDRASNCDVFAEGRFGQCYILAGYGRVVVCDRRLFKPQTAPV